MLLLHELSQWQQEEGLTLSLLRQGLLLLGQYKMQSFSKQPSEKYPIAIEWSGKLPSGATLSSCTVGAVNNADNTDATGTVLVSPSGTVSGTQSKAIVQAGTNNTNYKITFTVVLSDGSILEEDVLMQVAEV